MDWIMNLNLLSLVVGGLIGAFLSALFGFYLKRPVIRHVGGGSAGSTTGISVNQITIMNMPGFIGIRLYETIVFGFNIFDRKEWGFTVDRNPARHCFATLYDKEDSEPICRLRWQLPGGGLAHEVDIGSGEQAKLLVFARLRSDPRKYFPYQSNKSEIDDPRIPEEVDRFDSTRHFFILITHSYGRSEFRIDCSMRKKHDGQLDFKTKRSSGTF